MTPSSQTSPGTSSEISKDLKEKKEVVDEVENEKDAPADGNTNEANEEQ